jgi:glycine/D-amino acid oxidase-like deaminating enzyme
MAAAPIQDSPRKTAYDVVIIGGAITGSSTAWFLTETKDFTGSVLVVERDPTYEFASTLRASGGCRVQFTCPENIEMSRDSLSFIKNFERTMATSDRAAPMCNGSGPTAAWSTCSPPRS